MSRTFRFATVDYSKDASARGWGPGWPTDRTADMATFKIPTVLVGDTQGTHSVPGAGYQSFQLHKNVSQLVQLLLTEVQARGYKLIAGWCWSYEDREIDGTGRPSNHSWGLAFDLNAPNNPYTTPLVTDMPSWLPDLMASYGFAWGGDYADKQDAMHYEFMGTPAQAAQALAAATAELTDLENYMATNEDKVTAIVESVVAAKMPALIQSAFDHNRDSYAIRVCQRLMARILQSVFNHQITQGFKLTALQKAVDKLGSK